MNRLHFRDARIAASGRFFGSSILATSFAVIQAAFGATGVVEKNTPPGGEMLRQYFQIETAKLSNTCLADVGTLDDWTSQRSRRHRELLEMLGLDPLPARADLAPVITGTVEEGSIAVDKVHFQSMPGLYVTANLYRPRNQQKPLPAILYLCGHGPVIKDGISYGNKVTYQHHGAWFAQHGYVCMLIDTIQLGEIQGIHHGTHREGMWWWNSRGYTPAGVEAWNGIRAIDYLISRPEVDPERIGVTGRSGGGAYSWTIAALDDRVKVAAPVAGITDLQNHVVDGVVEGHCDCMFFVNTHGWDYGQLAALVAPRPLLIANSDKDSIFPLDGVVRLHNHVRRLYGLFGASTNLGLLITEGPHKDTQDLQLPVLRWFNRFLKSEDPLVDVAARRLFEPEQLRVFARLPTDQRNSTIHESFVHAAPPPRPPASSADWALLRDAWMATLEEKCFAGWPVESPPPDPQLVFSNESDGVRFEAFDFTSQNPVRLRLYVARPSKLRKPDRVILRVLDEAEWLGWAAAARAAVSPALESFLGPGLAGSGRGSHGINGEPAADLARLWTSGRSVFAYVAPRGIGPSAWDEDDRKQRHIRRRFMLVGQTLDAMRVWDIRQSVRSVRALPNLRDAPLWLDAQGSMGVNTLYASLFEGNIWRLDLHRLPESHRNGPDYLNVMRVLDIPQATALAAERCYVRLYQTRSGGWEFPLDVANNLGWGEGKFVVEVPDSESAHVP